MEQNINNGDSTDDSYNNQNFQYPAGSYSAALQNQATAASALSAATTAASATFAASTSASSFEPQFLPTVGIVYSSVVNNTCFKPGTNEFSVTAAINSLLKYHNKQSGTNNTIQTIDFSTFSMPPKIDPRSKVVNKQEQINLTEKTFTKIRGSHFNQAEKLCAFIAADTVWPLNPDKQGQTNPFKPGTNHLIMPTTHSQRTKLDESCPSRTDIGQEVFIGIQQTPVCILKTSSDRKECRDERNQPQMPLAYANHETPDCPCPALIRNNNILALQHSIVCQPPEFQRYYKEYCTSQYQVNNAAPQHTSVHNIYYDKVSTCGTVVPQLIRRTSVASMAREKPVLYRPPLAHINLYKDEEMASNLLVERMRDFEDYTAHMAEESGHKAVPTVDRHRYRPIQELESLAEIRAYGPEIKTVETILVNTPTAEPYGEKMRCPYCAKMIMCTDITDVLDHYAKHPFVFNKWFTCPSCFDVRTFDQASFKEHWKTLHAPMMSLIGVINELNTGLRLQLGLALHVFLNEAQRHTPTLNLEDTKDNKRKKEQKKQQKTSKEQEENKDTQLETAKKDKKTEKRMDKTQEEPVSKTKVNKVDNKPQHLKHSCILGAYGDQGQQELQQTMTNARIARLNYVCPGYKEKRKKGNAQPANSTALHPIQQKLEEETNMQHSFNTSFMQTVNTWVASTEQVEQHLLNLPQQPAAPQAEVMLNTPVYQMESDIIIEAAPYTPSYQPMDSNFSTYISEQNMSIPVLEYVPTAIVEGQEQQIIFPAPPHYANEECSSNSASQKRKLHRKARKKKLTPYHKSNNEKKLNY